MRVQGLLRYFFLIRNTPCISYVLLVAVLFSVLDLDNTEADRKQKLRIAKELLSDETFLKNPSGLHSRFLKFAATLDVGRQGTELQVGPPGRLLKSQEGLGTFVSQ